MWLPVHALAASAISIAALSGASVTLLAAVLAAEGVIAFAWLFAEGGLPARRVANAMTSVRVVIGIAALVVVAADIPAGALLTTVMFWLLVVGEVSDFADGALARRLGTTAFGARLDMEADAFFMLVLSFSAVAWNGVPRWVVISGLLRFAFAIPFLFMPEPRFPRAFSIFAKVACAASAIALLVAASPIVPEWLRLVAGVFSVTSLSLSFAIEAVIRIAHAIRAQSGSAGLAGLMGSFLIYYGVPFRLFRMKRFYRQFVKPGELVFDVGAHVGNRVRALRSIGARVVAVEPQQRCVALLERLYGSDDQVALEGVACGESEGEATLRIDPDHPTLATLSDEWIASIDRHYGGLSIEWDRRERVVLRTLESLVAQYGTPSFVKIDVEGFEAQALAGLRTPVAALSFEFLPASPDSAIASIREVERLGAYCFNYSMVESMRMATDIWISAEEMRSVIASMPTDGRSGDVYAVRTGVAP